MNILIALFNMFINIALLGVFGLCFLGIGTKILNWLVKDKKLSFEEKLIFSLGLGIGVFEMAGLILGLFGLFYLWIFASLLLFILVFTQGERRGWSREVGKRIGKFKNSWRNLPKAIKLIFLVILARIGFSFLASQAPVTEGDALWYHLTLPRIFIRYHKIVDAHYLSSYHTLNTEMLFTWAMLLKDEILAQSLSFLVGGIFSPLALYFFVKKFFKEKLALWATFIFILVPVVDWEAVTPLVELFWAFFVLLTFWAVVNWLKTKKPHWLYLAGIFLGLNFGTKGVLGALGAIALAPILLFALWQSQKRFLLFRQLIIFGTIALLFYSPYLIRNSLLTGNPFFPFFIKYFGAGGLDGEAVTQVHSQKYPESLSWIRFFTVWYKATMFPVHYNGDIGPFWFTFLPIGIFLFAFKKKRKITWLAMLFCLVWYTLWYWRLIHSVRYLLPLFPFLSIWVAATILHLIKLSWWIKFLTIGVLVLGVVMNFLTYFWTFEPYGPKLKVAFGIYDKRTYIFRLLPYTEDFFWMNENLSQDAKLLLYLNPWQRTFYLDRDFVLATQLQREIDFRPGRIKNGEEFWQILRDHQVTHIYGTEIKSEKEGYLQGLLYQLQNPLSGEKKIKKIYQGSPGFGNVYKIIPG